ncbi:MAG: CPBP family intramembrane metalloprotease [Ruminococcaceae bacterium]|nr:CPBP family intramembrane metalloprotease [Oscillospiraceae bacterium]
MNLTANESYYRKVIEKIGAALLLFWGIFLAFRGGMFYLGSILPDSNQTGFIVYQILYGFGYLLCFLIPCITLKLSLTRSPYFYRPMKLSVRFPLRSLCAIPLGIAVIFAAAYLNTAFTDFIRFGEKSTFFFAQQTVEGQEPYKLILHFFVVCLVPGFCEELLFRGAVLTNLLPFGRSNAILISSLLFALMHQNPTQIFYAFVAGIFLGILYEASSSIWPCVLLHILNNLTAMTEDLINQSSEIPLQGKLTVMILNLSILLLGVIGMILLLYRSFGRKKEFHEGVFGKEVLASDQFALYPVSAKGMKRLFWAPTMTFFVVICAVEVLSMIGMAVFYGLLG